MRSKAELFEIAMDAEEFERMLDNDELTLEEADEVLEMAIEHVHRLRAQHRLFVDWVGRERTKGRPEPG
jgi:hypothetical protein